MRKFWLVAAMCVSAGAAEVEFRAARSVHLGYAGASGNAFYNECVIERTTVGSYFMVCGWSGGYFGIQELKDRKVAIFSVWDTAVGDDPSAVKTEDRVEVLFEGAGTRIKRFGGEGTGGQCMKDFAWKVGETNCFAVIGKTETNQVRKTTFTAFIREGPSWTKLASFRVQTKTEGLRGLYSFVEDFRRDKKSVMDLRRARFGNGWIRSTTGEWQPLTHAKFTASNATWESKDNIDAGASDGWFYLATGGEISASRQLLSVIDLSEAHREKPEALKTFTSEPR